jgi:group I intron endonuclease
MIIYSIYRATNKINGKVYIGFDSEWPKRKKSHYYNHRSSPCPKWPFYNALKKYGWDNFQWEILYQSKDGEHCKNYMENYFIVENRSFIGFTDCNGYNSTLGGEGSLGKTQTVENKKKQSKRRSEMNSKSRWYNDGVSNRLTEKCPGSNWKLGRLKQKPTTNGCKWYNNGVNQLLTKTPPEGWKIGMLPKNYTACV